VAVKIVLRKVCRLLREFHAYKFGNHFSPKRFLPNILYWDEVSRWCEDGSALKKQKNLFVMKQNFRNSDKLLLFVN
jgi:hypothetical protein